MTRNLKLLGLALVAMLVLGGMAAQGAMANVEHSFTSDAEPTELTGTGGVHEWKLGEATMKCGTLTLSGFLATKSADELNLTPEFKECKLITKFGTTPVTYTNTGCKTAFDSDTSPNVETGKKEDGTVSLNCGHEHLISFSSIIEGEGVYFHFFDTHPEEVPVNQELHGATYTKIEPEQINSFTHLFIESHVFGLKFVCTSEKCAELGLKEGTNEKGTTTGRFTVKGYSDAAHTKQVNIGLSSP